MDPVRASAREIARAVNAREVSAAEIAETMIPHVAAVDEHLGRVPHADARADARARAPRRRADRGRRVVAAGRRSGGDQGQHVSGGHAHDVRVEDPRAAGSRRTRARRSSGCSLRARCRSARRTWTSSRWAARARTPRSAKRRTPTTSIASPAVRRPAAPPPSAASWRRSRPAATPAARSANRRRSATSSASNRPTGACRATA